jgi:hypothetical protein
MRYQDHHQSYEFDSEKYENSRDFTADSHLLPWNIPVRNVMNVDDVCVSYKPQDYSIVVPGTPDDGELKTPGVGEHWLNKAGVNHTIAESVQEHTDEDVVEEREKIVEEKKADSGGGVSLVVSFWILSVVVLM